VSLERKTSRRDFVKLCATAAATVAASPGLLAKEDAVWHPYERVRLVDVWDRAIKASELKTGENYLFHYPFISTPCFLLELGKAVKKPSQLTTEDGLSYQWRGGVGPGSSVVAFSAICAHRMTHPARSVSFINYHHKPVHYRDDDSEIQQRAQVIYCCSEKSVYDPAEGARVLGGPARQPLAAIGLEYDPATDGIFVNGTYGGEMFEKYFEKFENRLTLEYGTSDLQQRISGNATMLPLKEYCKTQILCG
jgi:arsenite oxidase small subunit